MTHSTRQNVLDLGFSRHGGRTIKRAVDAVRRLVVLLCEVLQCGLGLGSRSRAIVFAVFVSQVTSRPPKRHARRSSRLHEKLQPTQGVAFSFFLPFLLFFSPTFTFTFSFSPPLCRPAYSLQLRLVLTVSSHLLNKPTPLSSERGIPRALLPRCCIPRHYHLLVDCIFQSAWWERAGYNATRLCLA